MSSEKEILIQIEHLKKYFPLRNSKKELQSELSMMSV